ncbi:MAG: alanyl-tRNA editing protein [Alphaproteobacteria bacterium]|nr:alanyl-tRNA editing protein [Alphaproteobacteria bacterium]
MLFLEDSYIKEFNSIITGVIDDKIFLKDTAFYAKSGGQPGDQGTLNIEDKAYQVIETIKYEGKIAHVIQGDINLTIGQKISGKINWAIRYRYMKMHSTMHLLCAILPFYVTGGQIGFEKSRIDFDLGEEKYDIDTLQNQVNNLIIEKHQVSYSWITSEELASQPELVRTLSVKPPNVSGKIRLVKIGSVDLQPCGGTHVKNTEEIGNFHFIKFESKGKKNKRIHFTVNE